MDIFKIPVIFTMTGEYKIKANNITEAIKEVRDCILPLPTDRIYLENSLEIDMVELYERNNIWKK